MSKYWIFQDESGEPGDEIFIVGILGMTSKVKRLILKSIQEIRERHNFHDEIHFQIFSNLREKIYKMILDEIFKFYFSYRAIVVRREDIDLRYFSGKKHLAYNKFSEMLIYNLIKNRSGEIHIRPDEKCRMREDNFLEYVVRQLNVEAYKNGHNYIVKSCKPTDSGNCDIIQVCDLITGVVKNLYSPAGERKNNFGAHIRKKYGNKIKIWEWKPKFRF